PGLEFYLGTYLRNKNYNDSEYGDYNDFPETSDAIYSQTKPAEYSSSTLTNEFTSTRTNFVGIKSYSQSKTISESKKTVVVFSAQEIVPTSVTELKSNSDRPTESDSTFISPTQPEFSEITSISIVRNESSLSASNQIPQSTEAPSTIIFISQNSISTRPEIPNPTSFLVSSQNSNSEQTSLTSSPFHFTQISSTVLNNSPIATTQTSISISNTLLLTSTETSKAPPKAISQSSSISGHSFVPEMQSDSSHVSSGHIDNFSFTSYRTIMEFEVSTYYPTTQSIVNGTPKIFVKDSNQTWALLVVDNSQQAGVFISMLTGAITCLIFMIISIFVAIRYWGVKRRRELQRDEMIQDMDEETRLYYFKEKEDAMALYDNRRESYQSQQSQQSGNASIGGQTNISSSGSTSNNGSRPSSRSNSSRSSWIGEGLSRLFSVRSNRQELSEAELQQMRLIREENARLREQSRLLDEDLFGMKMDTVEEDADGEEANFKKQQFMNISLNIQEDSASERVSLSEWNTNPSLANVFDTNEKFQPSKKSETFSLISSAGQSSVNLASVHNLAITESVGNKSSNISYYSEDSIGRPSGSDLLGDLTTNIHVNKVIYQAEDSIDRPVAFETIAIGSNSEINKISYDAEDSLDRPSDNQLFYSEENTNVNSQSDQIITQAARFENNGTPNVQETGASKTSVLKQAGGEYLLTGKTTEQIIENQLGNVTSESKLAAGQTSTSEITTTKKVLVKTTKLTTTKTNADGQVEIEVKTITEKIPEEGVSYVVKSENKSSRASSPVKGLKSQEIITIPKKISLRNRRFVVKIPHTAGVDDELTLIVGDVVTVDEIYDDLWCRGWNHRNGHVGALPFVILAKLTEYTVLHEEPNKMKLGPLNLVHANLQQIVVTKDVIHVVEVGSEIEQQDEIDMKINNRISIEHFYSDGWALIYNWNLHRRGIVSANGLRENGIQIAYQNVPRF
ncbi:hypothetical protein HK096_004146, partial [Nowakowskiella sp. JEL0078]